MKHEGRAAFAVWLTGLPASGKSTVTAALARRLKESGIDAAVLESDDLRKRFSVEPSYDSRDREYFYAALAVIGETLTDHGIPVIFDATANLRSYRQRARNRIADFYEVFVDSPLEVCIRRDPKGIYRKARQGEAAHVPGLQEPYEPPEHPDVVVDGAREDPEEAAARILEFLRRKGRIEEREARNPR